LNELIIPDYVAKNGASAVIGVLERDQMFQQSNHNGELVALQLNETKDAVPMLTERGRPSLIKCDLSFNELTQELRRQKWKTYVIVENDRNIFIRLLNRPKVVEVVFVEELGVHGQSKINFFGEDYAFSTSRESHLYSVSKPCVSVRVQHTGIAREMDLYIPFDSEDEAKDACKVIDKADLIFVSGMRIPTRHWNMKSRVRIAGLMFVASSFWTKNDEYEDVANIIPLINSYDDVSLFRNVVTGDLLYPVYVNMLLWWNLFYVRIGDPVFNLILSGVPGVAKTHCLDMYARVFADDGAMLGEGGTMKGMIPSFSSDDPKPGALADSKFFVAIDEFFKAPGSSAAKQGIVKESSSYNAYLRDLMPVISRIEKVYASAKDTKFSVLMKASLLGTDNIKNETKHALESLLRDDPAVLRRFIIIYLGTDVWSVVKSAQPANTEENMDFLNDYFSKKGFSTKMLKRLALYLRATGPKIRCDGMRVVECVKAIFVDEAAKFFLKGRLPDDNFTKLATNLCLKIDFMPHFQAMVRCACVMRTVFECKEAVLPTKYEVKDVDYVLAEQIFAQVLQSEFFLYEVGISQLLETGGILRT